MIAEKDLRALLINDAAKQWFSKNIAGTTGWLHDWDTEEWAVENRVFFLAFLLAFDPGIREDYLRKKRQNETAAGRDSNFDESFLTELFKRRRRQGKRVYERIAATIYFHNDDALFGWVQNIWLNLDSEWVYDAERDDVFLATLLGNDALRVKVPRLVERVFLDVVAPFLGSLRFLYANKKYEYQKVDFLTDVCQRLLGRDGRRIDAANAIEYWLKERPCKTLQEWLELETYRELERAIKQRQRARMAERLLTGELLYRERKAERPVEKPISIDVQDLFEKFYAASPENATLCASYWSTTATFAELSNFYNVGAAKQVDGRTLNKRYGRALEVFKGVCENALQIPEIPPERWKRVVKIFSKIDEQMNDQDETTKKEEKLPWKKGAPNNDAWRLRVRFVTKPTEEDKALLIRILEMRRSDDTGSFRAFLHENTQGGGFDTNVSLPVRRISAPGKERTQDKLISATGDVYQNNPRSCGAPVLVYDPAAWRRYWRNKYSENSSLIFYFESAEKPGDPLHWAAEVRCPIFAEPNVEIGVVFSGYRTLASAPCEVELGKKKAACVQGVAIFKLSDFRAEIERNALKVTMKLRQTKTGSWHVKQTSIGRLLFRKPVVRDDE